MENSFELESTIKIFDVMFNGVQYEVQMEYTRDFGPGKVKDIFRMDGEDYVFDEELSDYINENL
jgi:hypothetical protein